MLTRKVFVCIWLALLSCSCRKENAFDCFKTNGDEISENRYPGIFEEVMVADNMEVTVVNGAEYKVEVIAGGNILENISTTVSGKTLYIENNNVCNFVRGYKRKIRVRISTPFVRKVTNNGVGPVIFSDDFKQDTLSVRAENSGDIYINGTYLEVLTSSHGNGDIYLRGSANSLMIYSFGTNFIFAQDFKVNSYIYISTYSYGDATFSLNESNALEYYIWGDGNIYYYGKPRTIKKLGGDENAKGKLIARN
jgi:hypothetical protein